MTLTAEAGNLTVEKQGDALLFTCNIIVKDDQGLTYREVTDSHYVSVYDPDVNANVAAYFAQSAASTLGVCQAEQDARVQYAGARDAIVAAITEATKP